MARARSRRRIAALLWILWVPGLAGVLGLAADEPAARDLDRLLDAVDRARSDATSTRELAEWISRLRHEAGEFKMRADRASRKLRETKVTAEADQLRDEHVRFATEASRRTRLIDVLREIRKPEDVGVDAATIDAIDVGDVDAIAAWIDQVFAQVWVQRGLDPAPETSTAEFLRRASIDIAGVVPRLSDLDRLLAMDPAQARAKFIDDLVKTPEYASNWAAYWEVHLTGRGYLPDDKYRHTFVAWLKQQFEKNTPYDEFFDALVTVTKLKTKDVSPTVFLAARQTQPIATTNKIVQSFLGMNISCAQCHNAPYQSFSQDDYHSMVAFMVRTYEKDTGGNNYEIRDRDRGDASYTTPSGSRHKASMRYYDGRAISDFELGIDGKPVRDDMGQPKKTGKLRRQVFSELIREDLQFARTQVNRMWAQFFGRGLVEPVFSFSEDSVPGVPLVLDALARKFRESGFDNHWLIRVLARTRVYRSASSEVEGPEYLVAESFARQRSRALTAEQMVASILRSSGLERALRKELDGVAIDDAKSAGKKSASLIKKLTKSFVQVYAWEPDKVIDENEGTLPQTLALLNSRLVIDASASREGSLVDEAAKLATPTASITRLYRATLARKPGKAELERALAFFEKQAGESPTDESKATALSDLYWSLMNSAEFRYKH